MRSEYGGMFYNVKDTMAINAIILDEQVKLLIPPSLKFLWAVKPFQGENLNLEKVELTICSSTKIYGKKFDEVYAKKYENIFNECKKTRNVNYLGFIDNKKIIELLKKTHIYAFPSIWPETSCISAIEAMAAGCEIVSTNLGALYETCTPFGTLVGFDRNFDNLEKKYSKALLKSIKNYWSDENQKKLKLQAEVINMTYSWDVRSVEWKNFFDEARR